MKANAKNISNLRIEAHSENNGGAEQFRSYLSKMKRYKEIFSKYDIDHDKKLTINEFKKIFEDNNEPMENAKTLFKEFDYDKSNALTWNEFVDAMDKLEMIRLIPDYTDAPTPRSKQKLDDQTKVQKQREYNETINKFAQQFRNLHYSIRSQKQNLSFEELEKLQQQPLTRKDLLEALTSDKQNYKSMEEAADAVSKLMDMIDIDRSDTISFFEFRTFLEQHINDPNANAIQILMEQVKLAKKRENEKKLVSVNEEEKEVKIPAPSSSSSTSASAFQSVTLDITPVHSRTPSSSNLNSVFSGSPTANASSSSSPLPQATVTNETEGQLNGSGSPETEEKVVGGGHRRRQTIEIAVEASQPHHYVVHTVNIQDTPYHPHVTQSQQSPDDGSEPLSPSKLPPVQPNIEKIFDSTMISSALATLSVSSSSAESSGSSSSTSSSPLAASGTTAPKGGNSNPSSRHGSFSIRSDSISLSQKGMLDYMERMKRVYELFKKLDKDQNRRLSVSELKELFANDEESARNWLRYFDTDKSGELTWDEFREAMDKSVQMFFRKKQQDEKTEDKHIRRPSVSSSPTSKMSREERLKKYNEDIQRFAALFRKLKGNDPKDNTPITREQLLQVIKEDTTRIHSLEEAATAVANIMREADIDRSGDISWSEFLEYMKRHQELYFT